MTPHHLVAILACLGVVIFPHISANDVVTPIVTHTTDPSAPTTTDDVIVDTSTRNLASLDLFRTIRTTILCDVTNQDDYLMSNIVNAYKLVASDVNMVLQMVDDALGNQYVIDNQSDFALTGLVPSELLTLYRTDLLMLPAYASSVVLTYRLDALDFDHDQPVILSRTALAQIFQGNITNWSDPVLRALNPTLRLPNLNITLVLPSETPALTQVFTTALNKFGATTIPSTTPAWPYNRYLQYVVSNSSLGSTVAIDGSLSYSSISSAEKYGLKYASLINKAGRTIKATASSVNYALIELGTLESSNTKMIGGLASYDITDATTPNAYPIVTVSYVFMSTQLKRDSCTVRTEMIKFWLWFYQSSSVAAMMKGLQLSLMPDVVMTERDIINTLTTNVECDKHTLAVDAARATISTVGVDWFGVFSSVLFGFYEDQDPFHNFPFSASNTWSAFNQILNNEVDASLLLPGFLTQDQRGNPDLTILPTWISKVSPIFNFDSRVQPTNLTTSQLNLDLDTLYNIFTGVISDWLHPSIVATNPDLPQRWNNITYTSNQTISRQIIVVVTRIAADQYAEPIANCFAVGLNKGLSIPFDWSIYAQKYPNRFVIADTSDMSLALVQSIPGAIGYRLLNSALADPTVDISVVKTDMNTGRQLVVNGDNDAAVQCVEAAYEKDRTLISSPVAQAGKYRLECWPFTVLLSFAVRHAYTSISDGSAQSGTCDHANATLSMIQFFQTNPLLYNPLYDTGVVGVSAVPALLRDNIDKLNRITCDGNTLLITYPSDWQVASGIQIFGWIASTIGIAYCCCLLAYVIFHRKHNVIKSASINFLMMTLSGVMLLFLSGMIMVAQPSLSTCGGFVWTASIGFMLTFAPLFAKTWRIYRIFGRKALKVIKISNRKLTAMVCIFIGLDMLLLIIWQSVGPMQPTITQRITSGPNNTNQITNYSQCNVPSKGVPLLVMLIGIKALLLIFGSIMAISTRRVASAYNESQSVAWSIYNTIFSVVIVVPISIFTSSIGDSLLLLMLFLLLWISYFTVSALFLPKVMAIRHPENNMYSVSESGEFHEISNGFSFLSPKLLSKEVLAKYVNALRIQLKEAEGRLATFGSNVLTSAAGLASMNQSQVAVSGLSTDKTSPMLPANRRSSTSASDMRSTAVSIGTKRNSHEGAAATELRQRQIPVGYNNGSPSSQSRTRSQAYRPIPTNQPLPTVASTTLPPSNIHRSVSMSMSSATQFPATAEQDVPLRRPSIGGLAASPPPSTTNAQSSKYLMIHARDLQSGAVQSPVSGSNSGTTTPGPGFSTSPSSAVSHLNERRGSGTSTSPLVMPTTTPPASSVTASTSAVHLPTTNPTTIPTAQQVAQRIDQALEMTTTSSS